MAILPELLSMTTGISEDDAGILTGLLLAGRLVTLTSTVSTSNPPLMERKGSLDLQEEENTHIVYHLIFNFLMLT